MSPSATLARWRSAIARTIASPRPLPCPEAAVEDHDVVRLSRDGELRRAAVLDPVDRVPLLMQAAADGLAEHRVVLDDEEPHRAWL